MAKFNYFQYMYTFWVERSMRAIVKGTHIRLLSLGVITLGNQPDFDIRIQSLCDLLEPGQGSLLARHRGDRQIGLNE